MNGYYTMAINTSWSKLYPTRIGRIAHAIYGTDRRRTYHNWLHIRRCYMHAASFEYDANLDLAIMFHDAIYDEKADKEKRSADLFLELYGKAVRPIDGVDPAIVVDLIHSTITHSVIGCSDTRMIMIDLADLTIPDQVMITYDLITEESIRLYGIDEQACAQASSDFMQGLAARMRDNAEYDPANRDMWGEIEVGINSTIRQSHKILDW